MKMTLAAIGLAGFALLNAAGQDTNTTAIRTNQPARTDILNAIPNLSERQLESIVRFEPNNTTRVLGKDFTADGVLPRMARSKQPWQFFNPFAPPEYGTGTGTGFQSPSVHPITHRAEGGISLLTIHF
jgi:hypothetical protein